MLDMSVDVHKRRLHVRTSDLVLVPVLVKESPSATLRLALDLGQVIKRGKL